MDKDFKTLTYKIYIVKSIHEKQAVVAEEASDILHFCLKDNSLNLAVFEAEAYHLQSWCHDNGFGLEIISMSHNY